MTRFITKSLCLQISFLFFSFSHFSTLDQEKPFECRSRALPIGDALLDLNNIPLGADPTKDPTGDFLFQIFLTLFLKEHHK